MKESVKLEIESRIKKIKERVVVADSVFKKYLSLGEENSVNNYLELKNAIKRFYESEFIPVSTPRGYDDRSETMYAGFKNHKMLACRRALKAMDKELEKSGISAEKMIEFSDPLAEEMIAKLVAYENGCRTENLKQNGTGDLTSHCNDVFESYISELRKKTLSELKGIQFPSASEVIQKGKEDFERVLREDVEKYKAAIREINPRFEDYQKKGKLATFEEYEEVRQMIYEAERGLKYKTAAKKVALEELAKEKVVLAGEMLQSGEYYLRTSYEDKASTIISEFRYGVEKIVSRNDEYVLGKCREFISTLRKMPMDKLIKEDIPSPSYFVRMAKEQQKTESSTPDNETKKQKQ